MTFSYAVSKIRHTGVMDMCKSAVTFLQTLLLLATWQRVTTRWYLRGSKCSSPLLNWKVQGQRYICKLIYNNNWTKLEHHILYKPVIVIAIVLPELSCFVFNSQLKVLNFL